MTTQDRVRSRSGTGRMPAVREPLALLLAMVTFCSRPPAAVAQGWQDLDPSGGPLGNRQMGLIVDVPRNRLVAAGGENSDGQTWELPLTGPSAWSPLGAEVPADAQGVVRAIFDAQNQRMLLLGISMTVYALDLASPDGWNALVTQGTVPPSRNYPGVAYDSHRGRLLLFGGLGGSGNDVWALDLGVSPPAWSQLVPTNTGPAPTWSAVAIFDPIRDRLVVATGTPLSNEVWALSLNGAHTWNQIPTGSPIPEARWLSAGIYDPAADALVICAGIGSSALNDVWSLGLTEGGSWSLLPAPTGSPPARWSHAVAYSPDAAQLIMYGGWSHQWHSDVWRYQLAPTSGPPIVSGFNPRGGQIGDEIEIFGARLDALTELRVGGVPAPILGSAFGVVSTQVPVGATTGKIEATSSEGTGVSQDDFFVGPPPMISSFAPDSARAGETIEIHGQHLLTAQQIRFNGIVAPDFVVESDELIRAVVDSLATSGPIQVQTLVGTATSTANFLVISDDPRPRLLSVSDVRGDQGGKVMLRWRASDFDQARYRRITGYRIWRRAPAETATGSLSASSPIGTVARWAPNAGDPDVFWESIAQLPAAFLKGYAYSAPTLRDSTEDGNPYTAFFVQAITADAFEFYNSSPDSGYSVDDLAPPAPAPLTVVYGPTSNTLHWRGRAIADLHAYRLYRGSDLQFVPDASNLVASTTDTTFVDGDGSHFYKLAAVDIHGNRSHFVTASPDRPVATLASFYRAFREPGLIRVVWYSGGNAGLQATVYRRSEASDWEPQGSTYADGTGFLSFEDRAADDGARYGYRIGILEGGEAEQYLGETWVDPLAVQLAFSGRVVNPSPGGRISCSLVIPAEVATDVRLFDVSGREVERTQFAAGAAGERAVVFGTASRLRAGVYLLRVSAAAMVMTRRVVVLD